MRLLGKFNEDISVINASEFGQRLGSSVKEPFVIGLDARFGSLPMKLGLTSGILASGCNVADLGYVPAPVIARIAREERVWGVHVSADPYPENYVGLRIYDPSGKPWNGKIKLSKQSQTVGRLANIDLVPNYIGELINKFDIEPMKIIIDSANGPTGQIVPALLRSLGMEVMEVNSSLSPIPVRGYEPSASNLSDLDFIVRKKRADFGVAFDGAGNKAGFITSNGYISSGRAMALLMKFDGYDRAIADFGATSLLDLVGTIERVPASEVFVADRLQSRGFEMGGGTCGVAFSEWSYAPDALLLMLEIMNVASHKGMTVNEMNSHLPKNFEDAELIKVKDVNAAMKQAKKVFCDNEVDVRDGAKVIFDDGWMWFQDLKGHIRISVEADSKRRAVKLMESAKSSIKHFMK